MARFGGFKKYAERAKGPRFKVTRFKPSRAWWQQKRIIGVIAIVLIIIGIVFAADKNYQAQTGTSPIDPETVLFQSFDQNNLNGYNGLLDTRNGTGIPSIQLTANSTHTAIALSRNSIDFSTVASKELAFWIDWQMNTCCGTGQEWGMYLTQNSTVPLTQNYNPNNDRSVALTLSFFWPGSGNGYNVELRIQHQAQDSITSETTGACGDVGSCYFGIAAGVFNPSTHLTQTGFDLNFTGGNTGAACGGTGFGISCSRIANQEISGGAPQSAFVSRQSLPPFRFQGGLYYIGYFAQAGLGKKLYLNFAGAGSTCSSNPTNVFCVFVPASSSATPGTLEPTGFFGPLIRALISIGVFVYQNALAFVSFLGSGIQSASNFLGGLAGGILPVIAGFVKDTLNGIGGVVGLNNIGTYLIVNLFPSITGFLSSLLTSVLTTITTLTSVLQNLMLALFDSTNGILNYWIGTVLVGVLLALIGLSSTVITVLKLFQVGYPFILLFDLVWFMDSILESDEKALQWWHIHEILLVNTMKLLVFLIDQTATFVYQVVTSIEGGMDDLKPEVAGWTI